MRGLMRFNMRLHRFFINQSLQGTRMEIHDKPLIHQLKNVLKLAVGEEIIVFNGTGSEWRMKIEAMEGGKIGAAILEKRQPNTESRLCVTLYQSLIKKDNFEWVAQKCTELGVSAFVPVLAARSEKKSLNYDRLKKIIQEAAEQSGRVRLPELYEAQSFEKALENTKGTIIILHKEENPSPFPLPQGEREMIGVEFSPPHLSHYGRGPATVFQNWGGGEGSLSIFIGPEGGWTQEECELARQRGAIFTTLGPRVLRSETAAVAAAAIVLN